MAYIGVEARGDQFVTFLAAEGAQTQGGCPSHEMTLTLPRPDYFDGGAKSIVHCLNFGRCFARGKI